MLGSVYTKVLVFCSAGFVKCSTYKLLAQRLKVGSTGEDLVDRSQIGTPWTESKSEVCTEERFELRNDLIHGPFNKRGLFKSASRMQSPEHFL